VSLVHQCRETFSLGISQAASLTGQAVFIQAETNDQNNRSLKPFF
jgi:hypothetical protein